MRPMRSLLLRATITVAPCLVSCGGAPAPADSPATDPAPPPPAPLVSMVSPEANFVAVLDGQRFAANVVAPLLETLTQVSTELAAVTAQAKKKCGFEPWNAAREVVAFGTVLSRPKSQGNAEERGAVAFETTVPPSKMLDCLARLGNDTPETNGDWTQVGDLWGRANERFVLLTSDMGYGARALSQLGGGAPPPLVDTLEQGTVSAAFVGAEHVPLRSAQLLGGPAAEPGGVAVRLEFRQETKAAQSEKDLTAALALLRAGAKSEEASPKMRAWSDALLESLRVRRSGAILDVDVVLPKAEPETLASLAAIAAAGVRRYVSRAKSSEARTHVAQIGKHLVTWCAEHAAPRQGCKFVSAPRVPAEVPRGTKHVATPADWQHPTWQSLGFAPEGDQRYSYEIEVSRDGRTATVRAIGDIDGDGVESRFELAVRVVTEGGRIIARIDEEISETSWDE